MFISEEEARRRLLSPKNLANRLDIKARTRERDKYATIFESGVSESEIKAEKSLDEAEELGSISPLPTRIEHRQLERPGRRGPWLPTEERTEIAIAASIGQQRQKEIAEEHGISQVAVAKIKAGEGLRDEAAVEEAIERARNKALDRLMTSLGLLTDDKISALDAKGISHVAANMARVIEKTTPERDKTQSIEIRIYSPELRSEKSFDSVEV